MLDECISDDELEIYRQKFAKLASSDPNAQFQYALCLVRSKHQNNIRAGLNQFKNIFDKTKDEDIKRDALAWAIAEVSNEEIDVINILNASFKAMHRAIDQLTTQPEFLLIDGNRFNPYENLPFQCIVKGDSKYLSIAAASVLAKTYRDELMSALHKQYPVYGWNTNVGYPTMEHRNGIRAFGITPYHRKSFQLLRALLELDFNS